jgi:zinc D-Ala-D-Ala dipeptidase
VTVSVVGEKIIFRFAPMNLLHFFPRVKFSVVTTAAVIASFCIASIGLAMVTYSSALASEIERLPDGFVYLADIDPRITQDIRYATSHNFIGRPITGYKQKICILTTKAAHALKSAESVLAKMSLSLIVWDCYRPERAVQEFLRWIGLPLEQSMKEEFYPRIDKSQLFTLGFIAKQSSHSRGSTVDLGLIPTGGSLPALGDQSPPLRSCLAPKGDRFEDGTIDFSTGYDCFDVEASTSATKLTKVAAANRKTLRDIMVSAGFRPYSKEWWHFQLIDEPFPHRGFDFPVSTVPP